MICSPYTATSPKYSRGPIRRSPPVHARRVFHWGWAFKVLSSVSFPSRTWDSDGPLHTDSQRPTAATKCGASRPGSSGTSQGQSAGDLNRPDRFGAGSVPQVPWLSSRSPMTSQEQPNCSLKAGLSSSAGHAAGPICRHPPRRPLPQLLLARRSRGQSRRSSAELR
jgi:hypothetical protein